MTRSKTTAAAALIAATVALGARDAPAQEFDRYDSADDNLATGPAVGARIPHFEGLDQHGERRSWSQIKGPAGGLILFYRSADW